MLTTIPAKQFKEFLKKKGVLEDGPPINSKKTETFKWDEMIKHADTYRGIFDYLKYLKDVKYVGEGSSRISFFLEPGATEMAKDSPACFKIAKNEKGIAQTKAEMKLFAEYKDEISFPKVYNCDTKNYFFQLIEFGTVLEDAVAEDILDPYSYFNEWSEFIRKTIEEDRNSLDFHVGYYEANDVEQVIYGTGFDAILNLIFKYLQESNHFCWRLDGEKKKLADDVIMKAKKKFANGKYKEIVSFLNFAEEHKDTLVLDDFGNQWNWGVVEREGRLTLIPIDWGLTQEVWDHYYDK